MIGDIKIFELTCSCLTNSNILNTLVTVFSFQKALSTSSSVNSGLGKPNKKSELQRISGCSNFVAALNTFYYSEVRDWYCSKVSVFMICLRNL